MPQGPSSYSFPIKYSLYFVYIISDDTPYLGILTEEKSCMFNDISGIAILVPILCWKWGTVTF
jgi:hypothetical protein